MISKELLSEVLNEDIEHIYDKSDMGENYICYTPKIGCNVDINIYELAHKCKVWAINKGYLLVEYHILIQVFDKKTKELLTSKTDNTTILYEQKRIFKACQWILDNKDI